MEVLNSEGRAGEVEQRKKNRVLIAAREASGKTQVQVAKEAGITDVTYQRYEYGKRKPIADAAIRIAKAVGSTVEALWGGNPAG